MSYLISFLFLICLINLGSSYVDFIIPDHEYTLDLKLHKDVLDSELCEVHINYMRNNTHLLYECKFLYCGM